MNYLILNTNADIPSYERLIRKNFAYRPIIERRRIIGYRLKQKFFPHSWEAVYLLTDRELITEIKIVYEYLLMKYI